MMPVEALICLSWVNRIGALESIDQAINLLLKLTPPELELVMPKETSLSILISITRGSRVTSDREFVAVEREETTHDIHTVGRDLWPYLFHQNWCFYRYCSQF